jgi:transcriptional regulator with XRE-family HTH domain
MPRHSYREHDSTFGQTMLTLRKRLRLTQAGLADLLGVSRRAVGEWEGGLNYPREEHLQHLIELCVQQHVFAPEREEAEIRALWEMAHQRVFLDERWLSNLLRPQQPPPPAQQSDEQTHADEHAAARPVLDAHAFSGREGAGDARSVRPQAGCSRWLHPFFVGFHREDRSKRSCARVCQGEKCMMC